MPCCINATLWPDNLSLKCSAPPTVDALGVDRQQEVHTHAVKIPLLSDLMFGSVSRSASTMNS